MSSSSHDDTISIIHNNIGYNSSEWKPLTFTLVEYPKGIILLFNKLYLFANNPLRLMFFYVKKPCSVDKIKKNLFSRGPHWPTTRLDKFSANWHWSWFCSFNFVSSRLAHGNCITYNGPGLVQGPNHELTLSFRFCLLDNIFLRNTFQRYFKQDIKTLHSRTSSIRSDTCARRIWHAV